MVGFLGVSDKVTGVTSLVFGKIVNTLCKILAQGKAPIGNDRGVIRLEINRCG